MSCQEVSVARWLKTMVGREKLEYLRYEENKELGVYPACRDKVVLGERRHLLSVGLCDG